MSDFPTKLETLRRRRGLSIRALATALDVGVGTVGGWLKEFRPRPGVAKKLADYFAVSVEVLLDDARELPGEYPASPTAKLAVEEAAGAPVADEQSTLSRLAEGIAYIEEQLAKARAENEALAARRAELDAELAASPGVADALAAGLTLDDVRSLIRLEIERRRGGELGKAAQAKIEQLKAEAAAAIEGLEKKKHEEGSRSRQDLRHG